MRALNIRQGWPLHPVILGSALVPRSFVALLCSQGRVGLMAGKTKATTGARLTHLDERGRIRMVDVGEKPVTRREAIARGEVRMAPATLDAIVGGKLKKGEALAAARLAGIMAAKRTQR